MTNLIRLIVVFVIITATILAVLAIGGILSSKELWENLTKVASLAGVLLVASLLLSYITKDK